MGMVRPEVRLAYRRESANSDRVDSQATSKAVSDDDSKGKKVEDADSASRPANLTRNREDDEIANPADRTS